MRADLRHLSARGGQLWRQPEFLKLWAGTSISTLGSQITVLALPLTAVLLFQAGPAETGVLTAAGVAPMLLFGLPAGAWLDRLPRRPIRIAADLASALVIASVPLAAMLGVLQLGQLYVAAFLAGTCAVWTRLSVSAMLPSLVGRENLLEANTKTMVSFSVAQIAGPSLAGILVQAFSAPLALLADAVSFVVSAVCVARVRLEEPHVAAAQRRRIWRDVAEGVLWLRGESVLFRLTLSIGLANLAWYGVQAVIVVYATDQLGVPPALLGLTLGTIGPAALVGALVAGHVARRLGVGPTLVLALSGEALSRVVLLFAGGAPEVAALCIAISQAIFGFIAPLWDVNANSLRQSATPERLLGRVAAASMVVSTGMAPVGALLAGWIGQTIGLRAALLETTVVTLIALVVLVRSPVPGLREPAAATSLEPA
ncbi:MAG: MFS transporter [Chloroflexi bacterium]|nr:MFS transporter [Chloroflexota bacterium]